MPAIGQDATFAKGHAVLRSGHAEAPTSGLGSKAPIACGP